MYTLKSDKYVYPPRATQVIPREASTIYADIGWLAQLKYNGSRCLIKQTDQGEIQLWSRHADRLKYHAPIELTTQIESVLKSLGLAKDKVQLLDGELLHNKHTAIKNTIAIWDILAKDNEYLIGTKYVDRYNILIDKFVWGSQGEDRYKFNGFDIGVKAADNILIPWSFTTLERWDEAWDMIAEINKPYDNPLIEGLVFKDPEGKLELGWKEQNNSGWMSRSRVKTGRHDF